MPGIRRVASGLDRHHAVLTMTLALLLCALLYLGWLVRNVWREDREREAVCDDDVWAKGRTLLHRRP